MIRKAKGKPTESQQIQIAKKQHALETRIHKFTMAGVAFLPTDVVHGLGDALSHDEDTESEYEDEDEDASAEAAGSRAVSGPSLVIHAPPLLAGPESYTLPLPSALGFDVCRELGLTMLAHTELALREGQANEALAGVRLAIGEKSFLFRKALRNLHGKVRKTRAWDVIHSTTSRLNHHRNIYNQARDAMIRLEADADKLEIYRILKWTDLGTSTAIQDPNASGQRRKHLSWIWSTSGIEGADGSLMGECEQSRSLRTYMLILRSLQGQLD